MTEQRDSPLACRTCLRLYRHRAPAPLFLVLSVVLSGCADTPRADDPAPSGGQALFEANCMECHGAGARGDGILAASLPVRPASILEHLGHHTEDQLIRLVQAGIPPAMPPAPISAEEIRQVIDYLWTLLPESEQAALRATRDSVAAGLRMPGAPPSAAPAPAPDAAEP